jgi:hypothetical protein
LADYRNGELSVARRAGDPADALNKNVSKGHAEKRKDGSFFITPEGLEALEGAKVE